MENTPNFQKGQQERCWTNQPPQGPWGATPWAYQGPWGWWNGPVNPGPMQGEEQSEPTEKHEGTQPNAAYGDWNPYNYYYGNPTGWNQAPTWWNWGYNWHPYYGQNPQQYWHSYYQPYQQQYWNSYRQPYPQQYWHSYYQPYQQQYGNSYYQPYPQQYWNTQYQWGSPWDRPQVPYSQWNWNYPGSWQYGHTWGRGYAPGYQAWNWYHPYYGGQDSWWNPARSAYECPIAA